MLRFNEEELFVPGLKILWNNKLVEVCPNSDNLSNQIKKFQPGQLTSHLSAPLFTGERDDDALGKEKNAMQRFLFMFGFLPIPEWGGLLLFWYLGVWDCSRIAYGIMIALLLCVVWVKFHLLRVLQEGSPKLHRIIERVLNGESGGIMASMMNRVFGKSTSVPLVLISMPAFLEGATTVFALPRTLRTFDDFPQINNRWLASWGGWMPFSLPFALLGMVVITCVIHAVGFYVLLHRAHQQIQNLGQAEYEVVKTGGFCRTPGILKASLADAVSRSNVWYTIAETAAQANLTVMAQVGNTFVKEAWEKLGCITTTGRSLFRVDTLPDGTQRPVSEQQLNKMALGSATRIVLRICANTGVRLWIKISVLADGFEELEADGRLKLLVAIMMGLLTMALTLPDQISGFGGNPSAFWKLKLPAFISSFTLFMMLSFRLFAVYFVCNTHIFNFSSMSCYDQSASVLRRTGICVALLTCCCCANFYAVRASLGHFLRHMFEGI